MCIGMKRKQKRYVNEREILNEIDSRNSQITERAAQADTDERRGLELCRSGGEETREAGKMLIAQAYQIRSVTIPNIERKLEALKGALAAFKTELLPGMGKDRGVVIERR